MKRPLIAGYWKMNTTREQAVTLAGGIRDHTRNTEHAEVLVCPPFPYLDAVGSTLKDSQVQLGAQDLYHQPEGAYTGEVSSEMISELGWRFVLIGHSERRHIIGESNSLINQKVHAALNTSLLAVLCVGETLEQRNNGETETILEQQLFAGLAGVSEKQLLSVTVAYEPVWAIGTGKTATPDQAEEAHAHLRKLITERYNTDSSELVRILYGGSVKPENAGELMSRTNVDGALVGGASLYVDSFIGIIDALIQDS